MLHLYTDYSKRSENVLLMLIFLFTEQAQFSDEGAASAAPVNGQHGDAPLMDAAKLGKFLRYTFKLVSEFHC